MLASSSCSASSTTLGSALRKLAGCSAGLAIVLLASQLAAAATPAEKCEAGKNSAAGKYAHCLQKAQSKLVAGGGLDTASYDAGVLRCDAKYTSKWQKLENAADGTCPTSGDSGSIQDFLDRCVFAAEEAVGGGSLPVCDTDLATCTSELDTCNDGIGAFGADLATCSSDLGACGSDLGTCNATAGTCVANLGTCNSSLGSCTGSLGTCNGDLSTCNATAGTCAANLGTCNSSLGSCTGSLGTCNGDLSTCNATAGTCAANLGTCNSSLGTCNGNLSTCNDNASTCALNLGICNSDLWSRTNDFVICSADLLNAKSASATSDDVLETQTFFNGGSSLLQWGTMHDVGRQNIVAGPTPVTITRGFHDGTGTVAALKCGNGVIEDRESCDSANLGGLTCTDLGFASGALACSSACALDTSGCVSGAPFLRVFVTSTGARGNFGGLAVGDTMCQAHADAALLGGTWTAWLSDATTSARDRIDASQYRLVDKTTIVAQNKSDLLDGLAANPIRLNEFGGNVDADVWTGTASDGSRTSFTCNNWTATSNLFGGLAGGSQSMGLWTDKGIQACALNRRLYCFEDCGADIQNDPNNCGQCGLVCGNGRTCNNGTCSKYVFTSSATYTGGQIGGLSGGDAKCQALAGAAGLSGTYKAWLASTGNPVSARLSTSFTGDYIKPSGALVAVGWNGLASISHSSPMNETETGANASSNLVWTGADYDGLPQTLGYSCNGWTSSSISVGGGAGRSTATANGWWSYYDAYLYCTNQAPIYCIQQ